MALNPDEWRGSVLGSECTFHQIAPYIGKMKSSMAREIIESCSSHGDTLLDPFAGSGAIGLEAAIAGRSVVCTDTNPYAVALTEAKLAAPRSLESVCRKAICISDLAMEKSHTVSLDSIPEWVRSFFHPRTLQEIMQFVQIAQEENDKFLLACLLGILHHQRPGFLSYPSSHLVPYLRARKFPKEEYPELYDYRPLKPRILAKVSRVYKRPAELDPSLSRRCWKTDVRNLNLVPDSVDGIITSPPYMDALDYARDNRLRLWFLGVNDYHCCNEKLGSLSSFTELMTVFLENAALWLRENSYCVCVVGEVSGKNRSIDIAQLIARIATERIRKFRLESIVTDEIPDIRRSRKGAFVKTESIVSLIKRRT